MSQFLKRTAVFQQLQKGFSEGGSSVGGVLQAEQYGDYLTVRLSLLHFAPLQEGRYVCILYDGATTEYFDCATSRFQKHTAFSLANGFCALICFVKELISPVACALCGMKSCNIEDMIAYISVPLSPTQRESSPAHQVRPDKREEFHGEQGQRRQSEPPKQQREGTREDESQAKKESDGQRTESERRAESEQRTADGPQDEGEEERGEVLSCGYRDDALAEENYYEREGICSEEERGEAYYQKVREDIARLFALHERDTSLCESIPHSEWVKVPAGKSYYLLGLCYERGKVRYLAYAVPSQVPAEEIRAHSYFVPLSLFDPTGAGYYVVFQDAQTGEYKRTHFG